MGTNSVVRQKFFQITASRYKKALARGAMYKSGAELEAVLLPLWEDAVTKLLAECSLSQAQRLRFKHMTTAERLSSFNENSQYGFQEFMNNFKRARKLALSMILK